MDKQLAVIFDMDGVLIDSGPIHFKSWKRLANEIGVKFTKDYFNNSFGKQGIPILKDLVGKEKGRKKLEEWVELKEVYYREMIKKNLKPLPGVINLIKNLKQNFFKLGIATSGPIENVNLILENLNINKYFDCVITANDIKNGKPAPDVFLMVSRKLNIPPTCCLVIEDAPVGIEAAKKAGMKCIALTTTHKKEELLQANLVINNLTKINSYDINELLKS